MCPTPTTRWRAPLAALVALTALGSLVVAPRATAAAPEEETGTTLEVTAGLRRWHDPGDHVVVAAEVSSDELFEGRIELGLGSGATVTKSVQVAGGTTKTFLLVAPTSLEGAAIDVRLYADDGGILRRLTVTLRVAEAVELVGVLPALATQVGEVPQQVNLASADDGNAQLAELSLDQMALGSSALDVFDTIIGTTSDLRSLQPAQRDAMLGWLNRGGRLLLDDDDDLTALPEQWRPTDATWALAGRGEVRIVDGQATSGRWSSIIQPTGSTTSEYAGFFGTTEQSGSVQQDLAARAGVRLPSMVPLLVPLIAYWVLVSVVLFFLLKSLRRLTLAWVAIPVLAAVTAVTVLWYGQQWRSAGQPAYSAFVDGYPGGGDATASLLAFSRDGGTVRADLPAGWQSDSELTWFFFGSSSNVSPEIEAGGDGTELRVRLEPGQVTTANVVGPTGDAGLAIEAGLFDDEVVGTVSNTGPVRLQQVAVFGPGGAELIGTLEPGQQAQFSFRSDPLPPGFTLGDRVWDGTSDPTADDGEIAELGIWSNASASRVLFPSGMVRAAGWTTERPSGVEISGGLTATTVVTTTAAIEPGNGPLPFAAVRWSMVRTPFSQFGNGTADTIYRYVVPPASNLNQPMVLQLPGGLNGIELWNGSGWVEADAVKSLVAVPRASIIDGVLMARIPNDGEFFPGDRAPELRGGTTEATT